MRKPYGYKKKYHDFRKQKEKWNITNEDESILFVKVSGVGTGIVETDNIIFRNKERNIRYCVHSIEYQSKFEYTALLIFLCYE